MRLDLKTRKKICGAIYKRYQKAGKKDKGKILDEYTQTLGLNRDYLAHLLANWGKTRYSVLNGKPVTFIAKPPVKSRNKAPKGTKTGRPVKYHKAFVKALTDIWELFHYKCGRLLAPFIQGAIDFLVEEFKLDEDIRSLLLSVSPATIDRKLKKEKERYRLKGISTTKSGSLLRNQIPIRVYYTWDERKPGFFEQDTVSHCGTNTSGHFCKTLTATDVGSGWTEVRPLLNSAHRWVKEQIADIRVNLPFPMLGLDGDNGGEFINHQLLDWCNENNIQFTRGRPYRKNDNCFVEQKNGDVVRKTVGYARFVGQDACNALALVYRYLNPLLNYFYPTLRLIAKEKQPSGKYKKIHEKKPKTPYQRLLESPDISERCKAELRKRLELLKAVELKRSMYKAVDLLLKHSERESIIPSNKVS